jgi:CelD/BcsL family acetyltransferase involved in cellulose biosynthesis
MIGGKQANYHLPLMASHAPPPSADALKPVLAAAGRRLGIDAYDLANLPRLWHGRPNPLFQPAARPNPSDSHVLTLGPDAEETLKGVLDKNARKKIRQKERYLAALGLVVHRVARSPAEVDRILDAYVAQRTARFRALGLPADIERAPMRAFLRQGCLAGLEAGRPAIELHALEVGDRIAATFGAAVDRLRASGMFISFDGAADLARCSPGDLLVARVIAAQCERGRVAFDLGVGEARYKSSFCPETDALFALTLPVTLRGRAAASALRAAVSAKRFVKCTPWAWRAVGALRTVQAKVRGQPSSTGRPTDA